ncbi:FAD-dependent tricarballylate dehydrogenase TcuA [Mycobacterium sp.]|uniref:FAD-dependent tricarballylate dehydrogenase TcuA n=1 Tax=Mycobacterium sp. TaxID=1785 RepID=UPI003BAB3319
MDTSARGRVIVLGAGNAALCAAISAAEHGADVTILEKAPEAEMGGNTRLTTAALRVAFDEPQQIREILHEQYADDQWSDIEIEPYPLDKYIYEVVHKTGRGRPNEDLVTSFTAHSLEVLHWLKGLGVKFELAEYLSQYDVTKQKTNKRTYRGGVVVQSVDGGPGLVARELSYARSRGARIYYDLPAVDLITDGVGRVQGVTARQGDGTLQNFYGAVVIGSGGFEASSAHRAQFLGPQWCDVRQRCVKFNTGDMILAAIENGAKTAGHFSGAHITPIDPDAPFIGGLTTGEKTNRLAFPWGISINRYGRRFIDEGAHWNNQIYVDVGRALLEQSDQIGYQIFDSRGAEFREPLYDDQKQYYQGDDLEELAKEAGIASSACLQTVHQFNDATRHNHRNYDPTVLDGQCTRGLDLPKSNWALPICEPPFSIYPVVPGITFTFGGLASDIQCRILANNDRPLPGLYGCGEATGDYFYHAYPTGSGLIKGAVTGREAGKNAARYAQSLS